jgi:hypothetical protein
MLGFVGDPCGVTQALQVRDVLVGRATMTGDVRRERDLLKVLDHVVRLVPVKVMDDVPPRDSVLRVVLQPHEVGARNVSLTLLTPHPNVSAVIYSLTTAPVGSMLEGHAGLLLEEYTARLSRGQPYASSYE